MDCFWLSPPSGRLATATRPRGGAWLVDDMRSLHSIGVTTLVSMLTLSEMRELELVEEGIAAHDAGVRFLNVPIEDRGLPERAAPFIDAVRAAVDELRNDGVVVVHCRMGVGRSSMFAASSLVRLGAAPDHA